MFMDGAVHIMGVIHWTFTDSIKFIVFGFLLLLLSCSFTYYSLGMHIIGGTYSINGYSIGTNGSMSQELMGGYQKHGLI